MFKYTSLKEQLVEERKKSTLLKEQTDKNASDIDYIAMMSDMELDSGETDETEDENNEQ